MTKITFDTYFKMKKKSSKTKKDRRPFNELTKDEKVGKYRNMKHLKKPKIKYKLKYS